MRRLARGLGSLLVLLFLMVGVPILLLQVGRIDPNALGRLLQADDGSLVSAAATLAGWVLWLGLVVEILSDLVHQVTHGGVSWRPRATSWARPMTSVLVAAVLAMSTMRAHAMAAPPVAPPITATQLVAAHEPALQAESAASTAGHDVHRVEPGEDLWSLADRYLGDGSRWRELAQLNPTATHQAPAVGSAILLPAGAVVPMEDPAGGTVVTVSAGDSLWGLAQKHLGDGDRWPEIAAANQALVDNPHEIEIGWRLLIPHPAPAPQSQNAARSPMALEKQSEPAPGAARPDDDLPSSHSTSAPEPTANAATSGPTSTATAASPDAAASELAREITGQVSAGTAAAILALLALRRRQQQMSRPVGRRVLHPGREAAQFETALGHLAGSEGNQPVSCTSAVAGDFDGSPFLLDLGAERITSVLGERECTSDFLGGLVTSMVCAEWSQAVHCVVSGHSLAWASQFDHPCLTIVESSPEAVSRWVETVEQRLEFESAQDDSAPEVYFFSEHLTPDEIETISSHPHPKMSAVITQRSSAALQVVEVSSGEASVLGREVSFTPQLISEPARRALIQLNGAALDTRTEPAPWWHHPPEGIDEPTRLAVREQVVLPADDEKDSTMDESPKLMVLGPVELRGTRGQEPSRALRQCLEYCGWILQNPGLSSSAMVQALLIAETTRRSNMSRLRTWLGASEEGYPYLPEAYTGRISLHHSVTCDWEDFESLVSGGVNRASSQALVDALTLVRGAPLADAAPGQWHWAEEWRSDMVSAIRDVGVELGQRALSQQDLDTARWAANRALKAAPEDEILMGIKIKVAHLTGDHAEVDRLRLHLTRHARLVGVDLLEETVTLLQEVVEGQARSRRA